MSSPTSSKKASDGTSPARGSLGVSSVTPRHGSIPGSGVGVTSSRQSRPSFSKKRLDPSDPSTWTSPHTPTFDHPQASSELSRAEVPAIQPEGGPEESLGNDSPGISLDGSSMAQTQALSDGSAQPSTSQSTASPQNLAKDTPSEVQTSPSNLKPVPDSPVVTSMAPPSPKGLSLGIPNDTPDDRRFSNQSASFSSVTTDSDRIGHVLQDEDNNEQAVQESSNDDRSSSDQDDKSPDDKRGRSRTSHGSKSPDSNDDGRSQQTPMEPIILVEDTSGDQPSEPQPPNTSGKVSEKKPAKVAPKSAVARASSPAALSAMGDDDAELRRAKELLVKISPMDETVKDRSVKMIIRGEWEGFQDNDEEETEFYHEPRLYLVCSDLSNEATYALEWTVGTLLKDGDTLLIINAIEDENAPKHKPDEEPSMEVKMESVKAAKEATATMESLTKQTTIQEGTKIEPKTKAAELKDGRSRSRSDGPTSKRAGDRLHAVEKLEQDFLRFVRRTTLQVRTMIEVLHCRNSRHLILNAIDELEPTLVVVGTRGQSSLQGVMMGSFSNYLVTKSSIPVMVARRRLKKLHHAMVSSQHIRMTNNLTPFEVKKKRKSLTQARID